MLCVTTHTIARNEILSYRGIVAAEIVSGVNWISDLANELRDAWGGRGLEYERHFKQGREQAVTALENQARALGANAIVAVKFSYQILGGNNGMLMVSATGTAVVIEKDAAEQARDKERERDDIPEYFVTIGESEKGPMSRAQMRELHRAGRLSDALVVRVDGQHQLRNVADIVA